MKHIKMKSKIISKLILVLICWLSIACDSDKGMEDKSKPGGENSGYWLTNVTTEHPRVFFNKATFEQVKMKALGLENNAYSTIKSRVDKLHGKDITFSAPNAKDGSSNSDHEYGMRAAEAAFIYQVTKEARYLELTKNLLTSLVNYYEYRNNNKLNIAWRSFSRINTLAAYDWIYNDLTEEERKNIGTKLLKEISFMLPSKDRPEFYRENRSSDITTGFYGTGVLEWYAGLVFYKSGIDDVLALKLLRDGYDQHMKLIKYRKEIAGDDGGSATAVLEYALKAYPWAELNFMQSFQSATGMDISEECAHLALYPNFIYWSWITGNNKEFGFGDADHWTNGYVVNYLHLHLSQVLHLFGKTNPEIVPLTNWLRNKAGKKEQTEFPITPFLLTDINEGAAGSIPVDLPTARFFENLGQIYMRSGDGKEDTYALFTADGTVDSHRHYDNNHFTIYKKGFVAMDTGTRPEPGIHLPNYYSRTIAHNCVTIEMPGEVMPAYWGNAAPEETVTAIPNDGGQNNNLGSKVIAFEENKDYVYIASDATKSYHKDKSALVLRQFVYLLPDIFIVYDRVESKRSDYPKKWLLHTATEPVVDGSTFYADQSNGRLFCRTLFPEKYNNEKVGGDGKQFWSGGRNWTLPSTYRPNDHEMYGQWRVEISPQETNTYDQFLHLIQVGDKSVLTKMISSNAIKNEKELGVNFKYNNKEYTVIFSSTGEAKGSITIKLGEQIIRSESFTQEVKEQSGYR